MRMLWWIGCRLRSDPQIQDQERTHTRDNESGAGFQKRPRKMIEMVGPCDEGICRTHIEESVALLADLECHGEGSYTIS